MGTNPLNKDGWIFTTNLANVSQQAKDNVLHSCGFNEETESLLAACIMDKFGTSGTVFVLITKQRLFVQTGALQQCFLRDITSIRMVHKNIHVDVGGTELVLFALETQPDKELLERMNKELSQAWASAKSNPSEPIKEAPPVISDPDPRTDWVYTKDLETLGEEVRTTMLRLSEYDEDIDPFVSTCVLMQGGRKGDMFVIVMKSRLIIRNDRTYEFQLSDITGIKKVLGNVVVSANGVRVPLFPFESNSNQTIVEKIDRDIISTSGFVRLSYGEVLKRRFFAATWWLFLFVGWMFLFTMCKDMPIGGGFIAIVLVLTSVLYLIHPKIRPKLGKFLSFREPEKAKERALGVIFVSAMSMLVITFPPGQNANTAQKSASRVFTKKKRSKYGEPKKPKKNTPLEPDFRVLGSENFENASVSKTVRTILVKPGIDSGKVRSILRRYYHQVAKNKKDSRLKKLVFIYIYDSKERIERGAGEWIAMLQINGNPLPAWPTSASMTIRVPDYKNAPSHFDQRIYEEVQNLLHGKNRSGIQESVVIRRVAKQFWMSRREVNQIWGEVYAWRNNKETPAQISKRLSNQAKRAVRRKQIMRKLNAQKKRKSKREAKKRLVQSRLEKARDVVQNKGLCETPLQISNAWKGLLKIKRRGRNYREAKRLARKLEKCRKIAVRQFSRALHVVRAAQRKRVAAAYRQSFHSRGLYVKISTMGKWSTRIAMKHRGFTRSTVRQMISGSSVLTKLKNAGFKRVYFSNYRFRWTYRLKPASERSKGSLILKGLGLHKRIRL